MGAFATALWDVNVRSELRFSGSPTHTLVGSQAEGQCLATPPCEQILIRASVKNTETVSWLGE